MREVTISIVSHNHGPMVRALVEQLANKPDHIEKVVLTHNLHDNVCLPQAEFPFQVVQLHNDRPLGFAENHNHAFFHCTTEFFCVMNPDVSVEENPFPPLLNCVRDQDIALTAPLIVNPEGKVEDSARSFPSIHGLVMKALGKYTGVYPMPEGDPLIFPDWVAGMFMLIKADEYATLAGFDEGFFLYYEDVDLCARIWKKNKKIALCRDARVIHDARRSSHKEFKFFKWHLMSAIRFFLKHSGRLPR